MKKLDIFLKSAFHLEKKLQIKIGPDSGRLLKQILQKPFQKLGIAFNYVLIADKWAV